MNFRQIIESLSELQITPEDFSKERYTNHEVTSAVGRFTVVERSGGSVEGDDCSFVIQFIDHNVFVKITGYYDSYEGIDYSESEFLEVVPKEKIITTYEPVG